MSNNNHIPLTLEEFEEYNEANIGHCINCGATTDYCEPDASEYPCPECCEHTVYGAQELLVMGYVE